MSGTLTPANKNIKNIQQIILFIIKSFFLILIYVLYKTQDTDNTNYTFMILLSCVYLIFFYFKLQIIFNFIGSLIHNCVLRERTYKFCIAIFIVLLCYSIPLFIIYILFSIFCNSINNNNHKMFFKIIPNSIIGFYLFCKLCYHGFVNRTEITKSIIIMIIIILLLIITFITLNIYLHGKIKEIFYKENDELSRNMNLDNLEYNYEISEVLLKDINNPLKLEPINTIENNIFIIIIKAIFFIISPFFINDIFLILFNLIPESKDIDIQEICKYDDSNKKTEQNPVFYFFKILIMLMGIVI